MKLVGNGSEKAKRHYRPSSGKPKTQARKKCFPSPLESIKHFLWPAPSLRGWVRNQYTATPNAVEEPKVVPKPNRPQTCHGAVKEPMRNARTAAGFEPTPSKMPLCEASESLERQQASCPRHAKHKPEKRQPKTVRSQPFHMVPKLLATDPKRPNATTSRARASQMY